jgi:hypothetical protein
LNETELQALEYFKKHIKLKETALKISAGSAISSAEVYKTVTSLFFRLASLRICHPKDIYRFADMARSKK